MLIDNKQALSSYSISSMLEQNEIEQMTLFEVLLYWLRQSQFYIKYIIKNAQYVYLFILKKKKM